MAREHMQRCAHERPSLTAQVYIGLTLFLESEEWLIFSYLVSRVWAGCARDSFPERRKARSGHAGSASRRSTHDAAMHGEALSPAAPAANGERRKEGDGRRRGRKRLGRATPNVDGPVPTTALALFACNRRR